MTVFRDRVHLLWPTFLEIAEEESGIRRSKQHGSSGKAPRRLFRIGLDWTRRDPDGWISKQSSVDTIDPRAKRFERSDSRSSRSEICRLATSSS